MKTKEEGRMELHLRDRTRDTAAPRVDSAVTLMQSIPPTEPASFVPSTNVRVPELPTSNGKPALSLEVIWKTTITRGEKNSKI